MILLASGTFGRVWVTDNPENVIKSVKIEDERDLQEVRILKRVSHPNVLRLLDHWRVGDTLHMKFRHYAMDLDTFMAIKVDTTIATHREIVRKIMLGVRALHRARIVHADLKPTNIFLDLDPIRLVVGDLGSSILAVPGRKVAYYTTPDYRAPEVLVQSIDPHAPERRQTPQFKVDAYGIALIVYELAYGTLYHHNLKLDSPPPPDDSLLTNEWDRICWRTMMATDPRRRCSVDQAVKQKYFN